MADGVTVRVLTTYPTLDASRRLRVEPIVSTFIQMGFAVDVSQIMSERAFRWKNRGGIRGAYARASVALSLIRRMLKLFRRADILWVHREAFPFFTPFLERVAVRRARFAVLDVDDAIYAAPTHKADWRRYLRDPKRALAYSGIFDLIACGSSVTESAFSGGTARTVFSPTCPAVSSLPTDLKLDCERERLLLWTGSESTLASLLRVLPEVLSVCAECDARLVVLGGESVKRISPNAALECHLWSEALEREMLQRAHVGIMPLPDTEWERGKSGYKAILYACSGLRAIVSPVGMNSWLAEQYPSSVVSTTEDNWAVSLRVVLTERRASSDALKARQDFDPKANARAIINAVLEELRA